MAQRVLVTGGAGYIGSHAVRQLTEAGFEIVVLDDLSHGHSWAVRSPATLIEGDMADPVVLDSIGPVDAVMHFAAFIEVAESVADPAKYYRNNTVKTLALFDHLRERGVRKFVFSSTAAVYGNPVSTPITEDALRAPINPYGRSKMMVEMALEDASRAYGIGYTILRYFNVAGAHPSAELGEAHEPETHLIPRVLLSAIDGRASMQIFGTDYPTPDGTCVRDYVHVVDLADAHVLALRALKPGEARVYNLGSENGFSVREVIQACEKVIGRKIPVVEKDRRAGDPAVLVASSARIRSELGWAPRYGDLETIVAHAWAWHLKTSPKK